MHCCGTSTQPPTCRAVRVVRPHVTDERLGRGRRPLYQRRRRHPATHRVELHRDRDRLGVPSVRGHEDSPAICARTAASVTSATWRPWTSSIPSVMPRAVVHSPQVHWTRPRLWCTSAIRCARATVSVRSLMGHAPTRKDDATVDTAPVTVSRVDPVGVTDDPLARLDRPAPGGHEAHSRACASMMCASHAQAVAYSRQRRSPWRAPVSVHPQVQDAHTSRPSSLRMYPCERCILRNAPGSCSVDMAHLPTWHPATLTHPVRGSHPHDVH